MSIIAAAAAAKSLQSCLTLCNPIDGSPLGSTVPGILQATILEWVAISFSNAWKWNVKVKSLSRAQLLATPWTTAHQAPPSMGFSRQEYRNGVQLPSPMSITTSSQLQINMGSNCPTMGAVDPIITFQHRLSRSGAYGPASLSLLASALAVVPSHCCSVRPFPLKCI